MSYTLRNLQDVEDQAVAFGIGEIQEARFPADDVGAESTGFAHQVIHPRKRQGFAHRHAAAEEVYVVIGGAGRVKLDDEIVELGRLDALRVAPGVTRQFRGRAGRARDARLRAAPQGRRRDRPGILGGLGARTRRG